jgi:hypothetical protein
MRSPPASDLDLAAQPLAGKLQLHAAGDLVGQRFLDQPHAETAQRRFGDRRTAALAPPDV